MIQDRCSLDLGNNGWSLGSTAATPDHDSRHSKLVDAGNYYLDDDEIEVYSAITPLDDPEADIENVKERLKEAEDDVKNMKIALSEATEELADAQRRLQVLCAKARNEVSGFRLGLNIAPTNVVPAGRQRSQKDLKEVSDDTIGTSGQS